MKTAYIGKIAKTGAIEKQPSSENVIGQHTSEAEIEAIDHE